MPRFVASAVFAVAAAFVGAVSGAAATGGTGRVSVSTGGGQADDAGGGRPAISGAGTLVAFASTATIFASFATSGRENVYLRDRAGGATRLVSATPTGSEANGASSEPALSGDGRYIAFHTDATNLAPGGIAAGIVVLDRLQRGMERQWSVPGAGASHDRAHAQARKRRGSDTRSGRAGLDRGARSDRQRRR